MTKQEANQIVNEINKLELTGVVGCNSVIQSAVNTFVEDYIMHNPNKSLRDIEWEFERKSSNFIRAFQFAMKSKLRELRNNSLKEQKNKPIVASNEREYLIKEVCEKLGLTSQNINHLVRIHNLPVREESARKRYLSESTVELLRTGKYK